MEPKKKVKHWLPLESNPQVFTQFADRLGFPTLLFDFHDVYSLDAETWLSGACVQFPVIAVILLYQIKAAHADMIESELKSQEQ